MGVQHRGVVELLEIDGIVLQVDTSKITRLSCLLDIEELPPEDGHARYRHSGTCSLGLHLSELQAIRWVDTNNQEGAERG